MAQQAGQLRTTVRHHGPQRGELDHAHLAQPELPNRTRLKSDPDGGGGQCHHRREETSARYGEWNGRSALSEARARVQKQRHSDWRRAIRQLDFKTNVSGGPWQAAGRHQRDEGPRALYLPSAIGELLDVAESLRLESARPSYEPASSVHGS